MLVSSVSLLTAALFIVACNADNRCNLAVELTDEERRACWQHIVETEKVSASVSWPWAPGAQEVEDEATPLFERRALVPIDIEIEPAEWEFLNTNAIALDAEKRFSYSEVWLDGVEIGSVGIRPKGGIGTLVRCFDENGEQTCPKLSYKLKFSEYTKDARYLGLKRLNLHSMVRDRSLMRDYLAYGTYRRMGVAAPRVAWAELSVNGQPQGLYAIVEEIDEVFLESRFPKNPGGNLYKDQWLAGTSHELFDERLHTNEKRPDHGALLAAQHEFDTASDATLPAVLARWVNVDHFGDFIATEQAIMHWDGPLTFRLMVGPESYHNHNFYLYQSGPEQFVFIPWDMDNAWTPQHPHYPAPDYRDLSFDCETESAMPARRLARTYLVPSCEPLIRALMLSGERRSTERLARGPFTDSLYDVIDWTEELLRSAVDRDPTINSDAWLDGVDTLKENVGILLTQLGANLGEATMPVLEQLADQP